MNFTAAADDFLMYIEVEKNYSHNTLRSYAYDLKLYGDFLLEQQRSIELNDLIPSTTRRFIQDQVINHGIKPRTLHRRISCLKSFSHYCLKENYMRSDFMASIQAPKSDKKLPVYMTLAELMKLFNYLEKSDKILACRNHLLFKLLATKSYMYSLKMGVKNL